MLDPVQDIRSVASSTFSAARRHLELANGQRLAGIYQRSDMLTSGRYAKGELQRIVVTRYDNSQKKCYLV